MMQDDNPAPPPEDHDDKPFETFEDLTRKLVRVPKAEVDAERKRGKETRASRA